MSTIKVVPYKSIAKIGSSIMCKNIDSPMEKYSILPEHSAWFEERIGQVVEVELSVKYSDDFEPSETNYINETGWYAIPPKQDLWDEAMQLLHSHNPFTARKAKLIFEILQNNGYTLQKK